EVVRAGIRRQREDRLDSVPDLGFAVSDKGADPKIARTILREPLPGERTARSFTAPFGSKRGKITPNGSIQARSQDGATVLLIHNNKRHRWFWQLTVPPWKYE